MPPPGFGTAPQTTVGYAKLRPRLVIARPRLNAAAAPQLINAPRILRVTGSTEQKPDKNPRSVFGGPAVGCYGRVVVQVAGVGQDRLDIREVADWNPRGNAPHSPATVPASRPANFELSRGWSLVLSLLSIADSKFEHHRGKQCSQGFLLRHLLGTTHTPPTNSRAQAAGSGTTSTHRKTLVKLSAGRVLSNEKSPTPPVVKRASMMEICGASGFDSPGRQAER